MKKELWHFTYSPCIYSHLFVVVTTNNKTSPSQIPDDDLGSYNNFDAGAGAGASYGGIVGIKSPILYVAAVLSSMNGDLQEKMLMLGNESISEVDNKKFYNAPLDRECVYYTFIRAYADSHTDSVST